MGEDGVQMDEQIKKAMQWIDFLWSVLLFSFFYYQKRVKKRCKFEVMYVAGVGSLTDFVNLYGTKYVPATFTIAQNGVVFPWSQYCSWLITCPVLLIHLSNLAGKEVFNVRRMMKILVAYQILMCSGATASMMGNGYKWCFYFNGVFFLSIIYRYAFEIFRESIATMPAKAIPLIYRIAVIFYTSWTGFGMFWFLSPAGTNLVSRDTSRAAYSFLDIWSKNLYSMHGWYLRWYILRKADKPEEFVQQEGVSEEDQPKELKILLVEQDEVFSYFFYNMLVQHSCNVEIAKDSAEVMEKTSRGGAQYDMIMINHDLAKRNNYQIMAEIRKALFMLPVIAYGRNIPKDDIDNRNATGIDDFLVAPFPDREVRNTMTRWSRRASVNPHIMMDMTNIAKLAKTTAATTHSKGGGLTVATGPIKGGGRPTAATEPTKGGGKLGGGFMLASGLEFGTGVRRFSSPGGVNGHEPTLRSVQQEVEGIKQDEVREMTAALDSKLERLMQQLADVETSNQQAYSEMQKRLEKQENMYQQQQYQQQQQQHQQHQQQHQQHQHQQQQQHQQHMTPPQQAPNKNNEDFLYI